MTLNEIETLIIELQKQVTANTAAIVTLNNTVSNYATTDDLNSISNQIQVLQDDNSSLSSGLSSLYTAVTKIDHLGKLLDVTLIDPLTEGDVLQYGNTGKWHNVKLNELIANIPTNSIGSLKNLTDVQLTTLSDNHVLIYDASLGKWTNSYVNGGSSSGTYLTKEQADSLYLSLNGGTVNGSLLVKGYTEVDNNMLVTGGITMYNNI